MIIDTAKLWALLELNKKFNNAPGAAQSFMLMEESIKLVEHVAKEIAIGEKETGHILETESTPRHEIFSGIITKDEYMAAHYFSTSHH